MSKNIELEPTEFIEILQQYSITGFERSEELYAGISNTNYKISTKGPEKSYLLKVFQDKNLASLEEEYQILEYLKSQNYSSMVLPYAATNGKPYFQYKSIFGTLTEFIDAAPPKESPDVCYKVGAALAELHLIKPNFKLRQHHDVGFPPLAITNFLTNEKCPDDYKEIVSSIVDEKMQDFFKQEFAEGIIHGDLFISNILFAGDELKALIDFEQSGIDKLIYDVGITISDICITDEKIDNNLKEAFLAGYESKRKIPELEKQFINQSILYGFLTMALWRIHKYKIKKLKPNLLDHYKERLVKAKEFYEDL